MKAWGWVLLIMSALLIKLASFFPNWIENNYTYGIYPAISKLQRILFGWIPFSIGDLLYGLVVMIALMKARNFIRSLRRKRINRKYVIIIIKKLVFIILFVYFLFYSLWGLNYNRRGIAFQLGLKIEMYTREDLDTITTILQERLNFFASQIDSLERETLFSKKNLFEKSIMAYRQVANQYSFLQYSASSLKPSLYSSLGQYFGFTGYYNPFSGEAQVNTTVPVFLQPFIVTHEMAHQLGYGKENEANFVGFLACRFFEDVDFRYSVYYDLYRYAFYEVVKFGDTTLNKKFIENLHPQVKKDNLELWRYFMRTKNFVEPVISRFYDQYLRFNNQPKGKETYNEVVAWLIAYRKKFGEESL
ncbi:MAG: DUF3810 domain-containing protein [Bacteroidota bacterium]|nr:DUF3810 domain-containing protein [Bacteroidota bacterium]